jgi:hypothetical protein
MTEKHQGLNLSPPPAIVGFANRRADMLFPGGFTFPNFLADVFSIFIFVLWFWLLITVFGDLFRRRDISGMGKVIWVIGLVVFPYLGVFVYLISQHRKMAERQSQRARDELRQVVGYSVADEIEKLERLKTSGTITNDEYVRLRARRCNSWNRCIRTPAANNHLKRQP